MTRIYITPFFINSKNIPNHASTHYSYDIYPAKPVTPKTQAGFAQKPMIQRKTVKDARPLVQAEKIILGPIVEAPKTRHKFRKNINKEALAQYFDNDILPSRAEIAQEKLDTWLIQTMFELENTDEQKYDAMYDLLQRYDFFNCINHFDYKNATPEEIQQANDAHIEIITMPDEIFEELKRAAQVIERQKQKPAPKQKTQTIAPVRPCTNTGKRIPVISSANNANTEINNFIADHFINKHSGADTAAAMRALDKAKRNNKYMLRKIEKTK